MKTFPRFGVLIFLGVFLFVSFASSAQAVSSIVPNFNLETEGLGGVPESWIKGKWGVNEAVFTYPSVGQDGSKAATVNLNTRTSGDVKWAWDHVLLEAGEEYYYEDIYKSSVSSYLTAEYRLGSGELIYQDLAEPGPSADWAKATVTFVVPAGVVSGRIFHLINRVGTLTIDNVILSKTADLAPAPSPVVKGMVTLTFDDGGKEVYDLAIPLLTKYGFKSTQYIATRYLGFPAYITPNQLLVIDELDHEIGAHTHSHTNLTVLTMDEARAEIEQSQEVLSNLGIEDVNSFAYPFGAYNDDIKSLVAELGFTSARSTDGGFNTNENFDTYALKRINMGPEITLAETISRVEEAVAEEKWLVLAFHHINDTGEEYSVSESFLESLLSYLGDNNIPVVTVSEGIDLVSN